MHSPPPAVDSDDVAAPPVTDGLTTTATVDADDAADNTASDAAPLEKPSEGEVEETNNTEETAGEAAKAELEVAADVPAVEEKETVDAAP
eukprot:3690171-Pyramimonas_sp.AAC.1